jgi:Fusaric acid resistance protein-like
MTYQVTAPQSAADPQTARQYYDMAEVSQRTTLRDVGAAVPVVLALFVPEIALEFTPLRPDASMLIAGILPVLTAWVYAPRYALAAIPMCGLFNAAAVLAFGHPIGTTVFIVLIAVLVGLSAQRGWHPVTTLIAVQPSITVISGYREVSFGEHTPGTVGQALICGGVAVAGGLWAVLVAAVLLRGAITGPPDRVAAPVVVFYTGALVIMLGPTAYIASTWFLESTAGWLLMTIVLVTRPTYDESRLKIAERALGTLIGGIAAAGVAILLSDSRLQLLMGTAAMVVAAMLNVLHARYTYFVIFLTAAVVLLNAERGNVFDLDVQRVLLTILGVLMVSAAVTAAEAVFGRYTPK